MKKDCYSNIIVVIMFPLGLISINKINSLLLYNDMKMVQLVCVLNLSLLKMPANCCIEFD